MQTRDIDYRDPTANLRGYLAWDETATERRPGEFAMARMLAELGHVARKRQVIARRR